MPKRLLIIIDEMEIGGSQRNIVDMARHIDTSAFSVSLVFFRKSSPYVDELNRAGVEVTHIPKRGRLDLLFFIELCRFVRRNDFDIIHAFSFSGELWGWLANLLAGNARFVSTVHSVYEWYSPFQWLIKRWIMLGSAAIVANSQAGADYAAFRTGIRRSKLDVVQNGVLLPERESGGSFEKTHGNDGTQRLLFVGRLVDHKNLACLLRAFEIVAGKVPEAQLDIIGDGPLRQRHEKQAQELGIEGRVSFHGEQGDIVPYLASSSIFVMTSRREGLSNAIMEAMCAGLPVVASNVGGNPELVTHEASGLLFPPDDHETLAAMLQELLTDTAKRQLLAENARAAARHFNDPRRMTADMERIYARCLLESCAYAVRR